MPYDHFLALASSNAECNPLGQASAEFCVAMAHDLRTKGEEQLAIQWLLRSLEHSVGMFHPATKEVRSYIESQRNKEW